MDSARTMNLPLKVEKRVHNPQIEQANEQSRNQALFPRILEMPPPSTKEPGTVKKEDHHHRQNTQPIDVVSSFLHYFIHL